MLGIPAMNFIVFIELIRLLFWLETESSKLLIIIYVSIIMMQTMKALFLRELVELSLSTMMMMSMASKSVQARKDEECRGDGDDNNDDE